MKFDQPSAVNHAKFIHLIGMLENADTDTRTLAENTDSYGKTGSYSDGLFPVVDKSGTRNKLLQQV